MRDNIYWPHFAGRKIHNSKGGAAAIVMNGAKGEAPSHADPSSKDSGGEFQVNDLRKGLKKLLQPGCSKGFSKETIYVQAWKEAMPFIQGSMSNAFWFDPSVTASMVTMIL